MGKPAVKALAPHIGRNRLLPIDGHRPIAIVRYAVIFAISGVPLPKVNDCDRNYYGSGLPMNESLPPADAGT